MLCDDCLQLGQDPALLTGNLNATLKPSTKELQNSAEDGCLLCKSILIAFKDKEYPGYNPDQDILKPVIVRPSGDETSTVLIGPQEAVFVIATSAEDPASEDSRIKWRCIEPNSTSVSCMDRIASLLRSCNHQHQKCTDLLKDTALPNRVLDLGSLTDDSEDTIRILETNGTIKASYVTLSHCWGKPDASKLVLKSNNLAELTQSFSQKRLAPVFRDAVVLTRHLGFRYLWIDALCIIQDSRSDWATESALMGSIYIKASLNIAAACSPDSNTPFLRQRVYTTVESQPDRPGNLVQNFKIPFTSSETRKQGHITIQPMPHRIDLLASHIKQPLQSRAWCFQERILATRTVFFDEGNYIWECHGGYALETEVDDFVDLDANIDTLFPAQVNLPYIKPSKLLEHSSWQSFEPGEEAVRHCWYQSLLQFGQRNLTYASDALPAMSAVARHYAHLLDDTYLAGIWKSEILRGLLWRVTGLSQTEAVRNDTAPSWSWASLYHNSGNFVPTMAIEDRSRKHIMSDHDLEVVSFDLDPLHGDVMSQMKSASLRVRGLTKQFTLPLLPVSGSYQLPHEHGNDLEMIAYLDDDFVLQHANSASQSKPPELPSQVLALFVAQWDYNWHYEDKGFFGLLLVPSESKVDVGGEMTYVRRGLLQIRPGERTDDEIAEVRRLRGGMNPFQRINPRKDVIAGIWDGWSRKEVIMV